MGMIKSILENDLYKFSQTFYYQMLYPEAMGTFTFKDRNNLVYDNGYLSVLKEEFKKLEDLALTDDECEWAIANIPFIPRHYWEWLKTFRFDSNKINAWLDEKSHLHIEVSDVIYKVSMYEIPILAIVSELYYKYNNISLTDFDYQVFTPLKKNCDIAMANGFNFMEFGMRRRYSHDVEDVICQYLSENCPNCVGTSTVYFAKKYNMKALGTQAHEIHQFTAAVTSPRESNYIVMENWSKVYDGNLGTVLTDTYTVDEFLRQFSRKLAKLFDGVRHDSGCPYEFGEKIIKKYESYGIDPKSKTIVFSDALTFERCADLKKHFDGRIKLSFGIGTNVTNNLSDIDTGVRIKPLNIVCKLTSCQMNPRQPIRKCVKLSDVRGKENGDPNEVKLYRQILGLDE